MATTKILVVEDDKNIRTQMKWALASDYEVLLAEDGVEAMEVLVSERPPLVTLDLGLPPNPEGTSEGLKLLGQILGIASDTKVIIVTGNPDRSAALNAISQGAHDFFTKPINIDELKAILKRAHYVHTLEAEYKALQKQVGTGDFDDIIGTSPEMQSVYSSIKKVATADIPVLITGESGTGKELAAKAIHNRSMRKEKPFVPINCGAIPENLMESELFGHEKGAFTGAHAQRKGKVEMADGGTLFLDEIGELAPQLQVKMLRFLQDHKVERVGGRKVMEIDVRVVAATNRDLSQMVSAETFREDLYYRLAVVTIDMPPLRERVGDIELLAKSFLQKFAVNRDLPKQLGKEAMDAVRVHNWPGNVRELENTMRRATLAEGRTVTLEDIGLDTTEEGVQPLDLKEAKDALYRKYIHLAFVKHEGNITKAAEELKISRPTLHSIMRRLGIDLE
ncbi:Response regulator of zinc sigma-54-dependent two-component system [hydrothermal vent metagenome]|uniref:Response regulator of zinc sigma-54-dependent two-component system n=1 Tax=hydrothermal vent metagenome TaxID=652676 RepID=A0A3B1C7Y3_9ZZZZ